VEVNEMTVSVKTTGAVAAVAVVMMGALGHAGGQAPARSEKARVERGGYLVRIMGCHDCHTPMKMGPNGPEPDMARALTGHPESVVLPPAPGLPPGPWIMVGAATATAYAGPWGVSFAANLTPDKETGLGSWTEEMFV
jgi:hypothetical protein